MLILLWSILHVYSRSYMPPTPFLGYYSEFCINYIFISLDSYTINVYSEIMYCLKLPVFRPLYKWNLSEYILLCFFLFPSSMLCHVEIHLFSLWFCILLYNYTTNYPIYWLWICRLSSMSFLLQTVLPWTFLYMSPSKNVHELLWYIQKLWDCEVWYLKRCSFFFSFCDVIFLWRLYRFYCRVAKWRHSISIIPFSLISRNTSVKGNLPLIFLVTQWYNLLRKGEGQ